MTIPTPEDRRTLVDPRVDEAWREASREEPAASVDAALLAAAHREVGAKPQTVGAREARAARQQWWPLAAAATVAAIAAGVLQLATPDQVGAPAEQAIVSDVPVAEKAGNAVTPGLGDNLTPPSVAPAPPTVNKPNGGDGARIRSEVPRMDASPRPAPVGSAPELKRQVPAALPILPPAAEPFPGAPKAAAEAVAPSAAPAVVPPADPALRKEAPSSPVAVGNLSAERASLAPAPRAKMAANMATSPAADTGAADARVKDRTPLPVTEWIALIRRLRDEGKTAEAAKELAAFRAAHADHEKLLPPDLRDWRRPDK